MPSFIDLTGLKFGRLTVKQRAENYILPDGRPRTMWNCVCDCGKSVCVQSQNLRQQRTISCGCIRAENFKKPITDITGNKYGKLTVLEYYTTRITKCNQHKIYWKCLCDCGNTAIVEASQLKQGKTQSCGCTKSRGEEIVANVLQEHDIQFLHNKRMDGLKVPSKGFPIVDFQIIVDDHVKAIIEVQGIQHYVNSGPYETFGRYEREVTDPLKRQFCEEHDIMYFEIKYNDDFESKTEDIIRELHVNTVPRFV